MDTLFIKNDDEFATRQSIVNLIENSEIPVKKNSTRVLLHREIEYISDKSKKNVKAVLHNLLDDQILRVNSEKKYFILNDSKYKKKLDESDVKKKKKVTRPIENGRPCFFKLNEEKICHWLYKKLKNHKLGLSLEDVMEEGEREAARLIKDEEQNILDIMKTLVNEGEVSITGSHEYVVKKKDGDKTIVETIEKQKETKAKSKEKAGKRKNDKDRWK